jgi:hypothetical protein
MQTEEVNLEARLTGLESSLATARSDILALKVDFNTDLHDMRSDVKEIRDKYAARPTWGVLTVIAGLGSLASALGATLLTLLTRVH